MIEMHSVSTPADIDTVATLAHDTWIQHYVPTCQINASRDAVDRHRPAEPVNSGNRWADGQKSHSRPTWWVSWHHTAKPIGPATEVNAAAVTVQRIAVVSTLNAQEKRMPQVPKTVPVSSQPQGPWTIANIADFAATYAGRDLSGMSDVDEAVKAAFLEDAKAYLGAVLSWLMPSDSRGRRGRRSRSFLSCLGAVPFDFQYVPRGRQVADALKALGWRGMVTAAAKRHIARTGALAGSFAEARETLIDLAATDVSVTRVRNLTLEVGKKTLEAQENGTLRDLGAAVDFSDVYVHDEEGQQGIKDASRIVIRSYRRGEVVGDHTVSFESPSERIEFTHHAWSRDCLALGALRAAEWVSTQRPRMYDMQDVLGLR